MHSTATTPEAPDAVTPPPGRAGRSADAPTATPDPRTLGIGGRITLAVMDSNYVEIIAAALAAAPVGELTVQTDAVSTWVTGPEQDIAAYFSALIAAAARSGAHVSASFMLSRGCPGEVTCALPPGDLPATPRPALPRTGVAALAQWALYPLDDGGSPDHRADHMRDIYAAIEDARRGGTVVGSDHYVTSLAGDVADIVTAVVAAWVGVGRTVRHVASHVTVSVNSPSAREAATMP